MKKLLIQLVGERGWRLLIMLGAPLAIWALWNLGLTAIYVQESVVMPAVVTDVQQKPFESISEALKAGNNPFTSSTAYRPIVQFKLPNGLIINRMMQDPDNEDYTVGQQLEVITQPLDPTQAHVNKWKFLWGGDCMLLSFSLLMILTGSLLRDKKKAPRKEDTKRPTKASARKSGSNAARKPRKKSSTPRRRKQNA